LTQKVRKTDARAFLRSLEVRRNEHPRLSGFDEFEQSLIVVECPFTSARRDTRDFFAFSPISTRRRMASGRPGKSACCGANRRFRALRTSQKFSVRMVSALRWFCTDYGHSLPPDQAG
jgi:hypothetical protein